MECEIYNEIAELSNRKALREADIVDWFENYEDSEDTIRDYGEKVDTLALGASAEMRKSSNPLSSTPS